MSMQQEPPESHKTGVTGWEGAYVVSAACASDRTMAGGSLCNGPTNAAQYGPLQNVPFLVWDSRGHPIPYTVTQGHFPPARGIAFNEFGGPVAAMGAAEQSFVAILHHLKANPTTSVSRVWHYGRRRSKKTKDGRHQTQLFVSPEAVDEGAWMTRNQSSYPAQELSWNLWKNRSRVSESPESMLNLCESFRHPISTPTQHANQLAPMSVFVFQMRMCVNCFRENCNQEVPEITIKTTRRAPQTAAALYARASSSLKPALRRFLTGLKRVHVVAAMDNNPRGVDVATMEQHGSAILYCPFMFGHVYRKRCHALCTAPKYPLSGMRKFWLHGPRTNSATDSAQAFVLANHVRLHLFGRSHLPKLQRRGPTPETRVKRYYHPWMHMEPDTTTLSHSADLILFADLKLATTRSYADVMAAILRKELVITVDLTAPVPVAELQPPAAIARTSARTMPHVKASTRRQMADGVGLAGKVFPTVLYEAEYTTWEVLASYLHMFRRALHDEGVAQTDPLRLTLVGSFSEATNGKQATFGTTRVLYGACFVELALIAARRHASLRGSLSVTFGAHADPLNYGMHQHAEFIGTVLAGERDMFRSGADLAAGMESAHLTYTGEDREQHPEVWAWPESTHNPWETTTFFEAVQNLTAVNETPAHWLGIDDAARELAPPIEVPA